jgi:hypothetical protein
MDIELKISPFFLNCQLFYQIREKMEFGAIKNIRRLAIFKKTSRFLNLIFNRKIFIGTAIKYRVPLIS